MSRIHVFLTHFCKLSLVRLLLHLVVIAVVGVYAVDAAAICNSNGNSNTVTICAPAPNTTVGNPVWVQAAANTSATVQRFLVYIDSQLVYQDLSGSNSISASLPTLTSGQHLLVVQYYNGNWIVGSEYINVVANACVPNGNSNTATICTPVANASSLNRVLVQAAANTSSAVQKFLVYVDSRLVYQDTSGKTSISALLPTLTTGNHYLVVQYYNGGWVVGSESFRVIAPSTVSVVTYHNNSARTGTNSSETTLNPSNVNWQSFGRKFLYPVNAQVYAQPLYLPNLTVNGSKHNVVFVATEFNTVYAFDANGNGILWQRQLGTPPDNNDVEGISPELGITSTPVIDSSTSTIYVVTDTYENARVFRLHALDLATGNEKLGGPVVIDGTVNGTGWDSVNGTITLEKSCYQRMGLALGTDNVYVGFGHCNHGWLLAYNKMSLQQTAILNTTPDGAGGALWASGAAPALDPSGNLFLISAVDANDPPSGYNDSFMKLNPTTLAVLDYFKPSNEAWLRANDADLGSGGVIVMPNNTSAYPHEAIGGGKDGRIFVINRDNMGGYNLSDHVVQEVQTGVQQFDNIFSTPSYWNGNIYYHCENDVLRAFSWTNGVLSNSPTSIGNYVFGVHGATTAVSSNGSVDGIVWEIESTGQPTGQPAILRAYDALNVAHELYDSTQAPNQRDTAGPAVKFVVPTVADGQVFVGTGNQLDIYGLQ